VKRANVEEHCPLVERFEREVDCHDLAWLDRAELEPRLSGAFRPGEWPGAGALRQHGDEDGCRREDHHRG